MAPRSPHRIIVRRLVLLQIAIASIIPLVLMPFGMIAAISGAAGALACLLPNLYFAHRAFRYSGARAAKKILRSFYAGEAIKLVLTAVMFALVFKYLRPINVAAVFGGFIAVQMAIWVTPLIGSRNRIQI